MKELAVPESREASAGIPVVTEADLVDGLERLGVVPGDVLLVHASLSSFGFVSGGEQAVIAALRRAVGVFGTVAMPSQSWQLCDPDFLDDPALDAGARARVRASLPPYDPVRTPSRSMGAIAELFRTEPGAVRSPHPHRSFAAAGVEASGLMRRHDPDDPFGETSPLARLYDADARIVLLGVGFDRCTSLHLAEGRSAGASGRARVRNGAPVVDAGERRWATWDEPVVEDDDFAAIGGAFEASGAVRSTRIGSAACRAMSMRALVDFAGTRMTRPFNC
ncbi:aminoglycoside N(3)-acetyltransferase [Agromyces sp. MMS24-K17]|uniref:aminoglycoside N(3)-acetyltransferase n=1 Tax=Agromyces sp. MMS24-K17 TaxID=3372850 RepID=UPI0037549963